MSSHDAPSSPQIVTTTEGISYQAGKGTMQPAPPGSGLIRRGFEETIKTINNLVDDFRIANQRRHEQTQAMQTVLEQKFEATHEAIRAVIAREPEDSPEVLLLRDVLERLAGLKELPAGIESLRQQGAAAAETGGRIDGKLSVVEQGVAHLCEQSAVAQGAARKTDEGIAALAAEFAQLREQSAATAATATRTHEQLGVVNEVIAPLERQLNSSEATMRELHGKFDALDQAMAQVRAVHEASEHVIRETSDLGRRIESLEARLSETRQAMVVEQEIFKSMQATVAELRRDQWQLETAAADRQFALTTEAQSTRRSARIRGWFLGTGIVAILAALIPILVKTYQ